MADDLTTDRTCAKCGRMQPVENFARNRCARTGRIGTCRECLRDYQRDRAAQIRAGTWAPAPRRRQAPARTPFSDVEPLRRLRLDLSEQRTRGFSFSLAWSIAVPYALDGLHGDEQRSWREVLEETRAAWNAAYDGLPFDGFAADLLMLDEPDEWVGRELVIA